MAEAPALQRVRLTLGDLVWIIGSLAGAAAVLWIAAQTLAELRAADVEHVRELAKVRADLSAAAASGREARERVDSNSAARHQLQQAEIDRLRVEAASFSSFVASTGERLRNVERILERIEATVSAPRAEAPAPAPVAAAAPPRGLQLIPRRAWSGDAR